MGLCLIHNVFKYVRILVFQYCQPYSLKNQLCYEKYPITSGAKEWIRKKVNQKTKYSKFNHFFSKNFSTFTAPALPITMESSCNEKKIKACNMIQNVLSKSVVMRLKVLRSSAQSIVLFKRCYLFFIDYR